jgi:hypothetical protein
MEPTVIKVPAIYREADVWRWVHGLSTAEYERAWFHHVTFHPRRPSGLAHHSRLLLLHQACSTAGLPSSLGPSLPAKLHKACVAAWSALRSAADRVAPVLARVSDDILSCKCVSRGCQMSSSFRCGCSSQSIMTRVGMSRVLLLGKAPIDLVSTSLNSHEGLKGVRAASHHHIWW